ncbi:hypothetical protein K438DRAFT_1757256 [Mycena galopus ATCC 62051]|nr:hypothetical protein K438DRAFT_1757256 [Mycena galopus ATCC 62051]
MSQTSSQRRTRVYLACCLTDNVDQKPCQRCIHKGLKCEYLLVAEEEKCAPIVPSDNFTTPYSPGPPPPPPGASCSRLHAAPGGNLTANPGYPQSPPMAWYDSKSTPWDHALKSSATFTQQLGNQQIHPSSYYPANTPANPAYVSAAQAPHQGSFPRFPPNYGHTTHWSRSPQSTHPQYVISSSKFNAQH